MADTINIKDPLIIVANGPSVTQEDLEIIRNYDTFAMKGSYRLFPKLNWWPKYWSYFDTRWIQTLNRFEEVKNLITKDNPIEQFFLFSIDKLKFPENKKITFLYPIHDYYYPDKSIIFDEQKEKEKFIKAYMRLKKVNRNEALITYYNIKDEYWAPDGYEYNYMAYLNILYKKPVGPKEMIKHGHRYYQCPKNIRSFNEFYCPEGSSALAACRIGTILGYKKIILLGVDLNYDPTDKNIYWNDNICDPEDPVKTEKEIYMNITNKIAGVNTWSEYLDIMINKRNNFLFNKFRINNPDINVINCSLNSNLSCYPKMKLKDALNV